MDKLLFPVLAKPVLPEAVRVFEAQVRLVSTRDLEF